MVDQQIEQIIIDGFSVQKTDDEIIVDLINSGLSFKQAGKIFNDVCEEKGLKVSAKKRKEAVYEIANSYQPSPESSEELENMIEKIVSEVPKTTDKQVFVCLKNWAKEHNVRLPRRKAQKRGSLLDKLLEHCLSNRDMSEQDAKEFLKSEKPSIKDVALRNHMNQYSMILEFAKKWTS